MKRALLPLIVGVAMCGSTAQAAVVLDSATAVPTTGGVYDGPVTIDFESSALGGNIVTGSNTGNYVPPEGTPLTGQYFSAGPSTGGSPGIIDLTGLGLSGIASLSLVWGTVDLYNRLEVLDSANHVLGQVTGSQILPGANGTLSRLVTLTFTGATQGQAAKLALYSNNDAADTNAFEADNIAIQAVPEASTWMMLILGMLGIGFAMRRRNSEPSVRVRYV